MNTEQIRLRLFRLVARLLRVEFRFVGFTPKGEIWGDRYKHPAPMRDLGQD